MISGFNSLGSKGSEFIPGTMDADLEYLGSKVLTTGASTTGVLTIPSRDILVLCVRVTGYSGGDIASLRFNGDSGANYWSRYLNAAAGGVTFTNNQNASQTLARLFALTTTLQRSAIIKITNNTTTSKLAVVNGLTGTGSAATAGFVEFGGFEWVNTTAKIKSVEMLTAGGQNLFTGTGFAVFGKNL